VPGTSSRTNDFQGPKFSTSVQNTDTKNEEAKELRSRTYGREVKPNHNPTIHQHAQAGSQAERRK
jgi:hypothetical protein